VSKKLIASAKEVEEQKLGEMVINKVAMALRVFRIAKQMVKKIKDDVAPELGCMKDVNRGIGVDEENNENVMSEEFDWEKDNLEGGKPVGGPVSSYQHRSIRR